jgi:hypothetical protein
VTTRRLWSGHRPILRQAQLAESAVTCRDTASTPGTGKLASPARLDLRPRPEVAVMAKHLLLFNFTGESIKRFAAKPSDRSAVIREMAESLGAA